MGGRVQSLVFCNSRRVASRADGRAPGRRQGARPIERAGRTSRVERSAPPGGLRRARADTSSPSGGLIGSADSRRHRGGEE
ncbi:hypothetical protein N9M16_04205 [Candidatus Dependentiae bacterium]|nr:hypothetical protein [Candidatus Dependentiae bacterium]